MPNSLLNSSPSSAFTPRWVRLLRVLGLAASVLFGTSYAQAGTLSSWRGTTSTAWGTSTNWTTAVTNSGTYSLVFGGTTRTTTNNDIGTVSIDSLSFTNNGSAGRTSAFTLSGSNLQIVNAAVATTASIGGAITDVISAPVEIVGSSTFTLGTNHNMTLSNSVTGGSIRKTGPGSLTLTGSIATDLSVAQGILTVTGNTVRGLDGRIVDMSPASGLSGNLNLNAVSGTSSVQFGLNRNSTVTVANNSNFVFSNPSFNVSTVATSSTLTLAGGAAGNRSTATIAGAIQDNTGGAVSVSVADNNAWIFSGNNSYTGSTVVGAGAKLLVDGGVSGSGVTSAGYLGGTGVIGSPVSIIGGTLAPGGISTSGGVVTDTIGILTMTNSLSLGAVAAFTIGGELAGTGYDQIYGSGASLAYGGSLALTLTGTQAYAKDTTFNLFKDFATRSGNFSSVTLSAVGTPYNGLVFTNLGGGIWETGSTGFPLGESLRFDQTTGDLVVVPEPSTFVLAGLGVVLAGAQVWRRRRAAA
jgi:fibronectin-binding autotransporter adhesin